MLNLSFDILKKIKRRIFPFYKDKEIKLIFETLQSGFSNEVVVARFVGGCVRKYLLGEKIDDIDIATILTVDQIKEKLKNSSFKVIDTGVEHGTVTIISKKHKLEITTLRKDIETDGRHAKIEYTDDWKLDSERRDFTINSIYLDIDGKIFDPQMGTVDLKNRNVKFIGDPQKRIEEDYLRIIRFIRFKIMYDLKVETTTNDAIKQNLDGIKKISKERILLELFKILEIKNFLKINESNYLKEIFLIVFPEFLYLSRLKRLSEIYNHSFFNRNIILGVLLIDEKDNHDYFSHKYNVSNKIKKNLRDLSSDISKLKKNKNFLGIDLTKNLYLYGKSHLISLCIINYTLDRKVKLEDFSKTIKKILNINIPKFKIDGEYLKQNGMSEGESIGKVLKIIEREWIKNSFKISDDRIKELIQVNKN